MTRTRARRPTFSDFAADSEIDGLGFTCFRLVPTSDGLQPVELMFMTSRMSAFTLR